MLHLVSTVRALSARTGTKSTYVRHSSDACSRRTAWWEPPRGACKARSGGRDMGAWEHWSGSTHPSESSRLPVLHQDPQAPNFHIQATLIPGWTMVLPLATLWLHAGHPVMPNKMNTDCTSMENSAFPGRTRPPGWTLQGCLQLLTTGTASNFWEFMV